MSTPMILANMAVGPLLLILTLIFRAFPPKKINSFYGYRTARSMKSQETWEAANKYANNLMVWVAIITIIAQVIFFFLFEPATVLMIACVIMSVLLISILIIVEKYLKDHFDSDGKELT